MAEDPTENEREDGAGTSPADMPLGEDDQTFVTGDVTHDDRPLDESPAPPEEAKSAAPPPVASKSIAPTSVAPPSSEHYESIEPLPPSAAPAIGMMKAPPLPRIGGERGSVPPPPPPPPPPRRNSQPEIVVAKPRKSRGPEEVHGSTGASQLPPAPIDKIEAIAAAVARLRAEVDATIDKPRRARLLVEAAEIQESGGDESGAARDYLQSYNADTSFREPL